MLRDYIYLGGVKKRKFLRRFLLIALIKYYFRSSKKLGVIGF